MASHEADGRAVEAGYTNVSDLAGGFKGWKDAGKPVGKS